MSPKDHRRQPVTEPEPMSLPLNHLSYKKVEKKPGVNKIQPMNPCDAEADLDDWIKKMDFATMIFSLVSFLVFSSLYWIIALL